jgi:DNA-binding SARP family transcriptional activator
MEDHFPVLRVFLLGPFRVELVQPDGERRVIEDFEALLGRDLSAILFKLILIHPERRVKRDVLVRTLWPGQSLTSIRHSLEVTKSKLGRTLLDLCGRSLLPRAIGNPPIYAIASQTEIWTDLEACLQARNQALSTIDPTSSLGYWEEVYAFMQRGELLADDTTAYWYRSSLVQDRRTKLIQVRRQCVLRIADLALECGNTSRALEVLKEECAAHPADEDLAFHLMNVLARLGRYPEALACYTQLEAALLERNAEPGEETKRLALRLRGAGVTKHWSSEEMGIQASVWPSPEENRADEVGALAFSIPPVESSHRTSFYGHKHELTPLSQWITGGSARIGTLPTDLNFYEKKLRLAVHIHRTSNAQGLLQDVDHDIYELEDLEE